MNKKHFNFRKEFEKVSNEYADLLKELFVSNPPYIVGNEHIIIRLKNYAIEVSELEQKHLDQEESEYDN